MAALKLLHVLQITRRIVLHILSSDYLGTCNSRNLLHNQRTVINEGHNSETRGAGTEAETTGEDEGGGCDCGCASWSAETNQWQVLVVIMTERLLEASSGGQPQTGRGSFCGGSNFALIGHTELTRPASENAPTLPACLPLVD